MTKPDAKCDLTAGEVFDSLTGQDEMEIATQFGRNISDLTDNDPSMWGRALIFVVLRRAGEVDSDAYTKAMAMTMKETTSYFPAESKESGKGEPEPQPEPGVSLSSVS